MTDSAPAAKPEKIRAVKGMNDILPPASAQWEWFEAHVRALMDAFAYRNIRTPILEHTALFVRGIGEVTDVVEKEMYSFEDRSDRHGQAERLSMRPENTASVVRACIESSLLHSGGKRLYYMGPMFRRERPQRGRYRQFHQLGAEALGFPGADMDAEMILLAVALFRRIGITGWTLELNSLGQPAERARHRTELIAWFQAHEDQLDEDARRRLHSNPLRILDTKNPAMQPLVEAAPKLIDFLGADSLAHLKMVQDMLNANGVPWRLNPRLVRGLDYYNLTVFEFITQSLGAQGTLCAGGRYDYLFEQVGGAATPAVGWALGIERVLELLREQGAEIPEKKPLAYAIIPDAQGIAAALCVLQGLRAVNVSVQMNACAAQGAPGSMKSQFRKADASGAQYALIFGPDELARGELALKALRDGSVQQRTFALDDIAALAQALQSPVSQ